MIIPIAFIRMERLKVQSAGQSVVGEYSPLVVLMSLLIFAGFANLDLKVSCKRAASSCFYVYLFHAGILEGVSHFKILSQPSFFSMVGAVVVVYALSSAATAGYMYIQRIWAGKHSIIQGKQR